MKENDDVKGNTEGYRPNLALSKFEGLTPIEEWLVEARFIVEYLSENKRAIFINS